MNRIKTIQHSFWSQPVDHCSSVVVVLSYFFKIIFPAKTGRFYHFFFVLFFVYCACVCIVDYTAKQVFWPLTSAAETTPRLETTPKMSRKIPVTLWNLSSIIKAILRHRLRLLFWTARAQVFTLPVRVLKISLMMLRLEFFFFFLHTSRVSVSVEFSTVAQLVQLISTERRNFSLNSLQRLLKGFSLLMWPVIFTGRWPVDKTLKNRLGLAQHPFLCMNVWFLCQTLCCGSGQKLYRSPENTRKQSLQPPTKTATTSYFFYTSYSSYHFTLFCMCMYLWLCSGFKRYRRSHMQYFYSSVTSYSLNWRLIILTLCLYVSHLFF